MFATGSNMTFAEFNAIMDYVCLITMFISGYMLARISR